jgi:lysophospholipase L1-like esterase
VAIIGDSISQIATPDLTRALRQYNVYVDAVGGTLMADHLAKIQRVVSEGQTSDWVIELGTNDALRENPSWASDFTNEVTALEAQTCVVFVTINPRFGVIGDGINQAIDSAVASHPNFHSLDWGDVQLNKPQWLQSDGIHPTKAGSAELAKLERKAILGCQGR